MASNATGLAAVVPGPRESIDGNGGVFSLIMTNASQRFEIPDVWKGRFIRVYAKEYEIQLLLGDSDVSVTWDQASGISDEVITTNDATGDSFGADQADHFMVPRKGKITHFAAVCNTAELGTLKIRPA
jgi:hypothetical protein